MSGLSQLEYHIGYESGTTDRIHVRIWKNSGGGKFNTDWVSLSRIEKVMAKVPAGEAFKASALNPVMEGRSVNTPSFISGALLAEGLIVRSETAVRMYERGNADIWWKKMQTLISAGTNLEPVPIVHSAGHSSGTAAKLRVTSPKKSKPTAAPATTAES